MMIAFDINTTTVIAPVQRASSDWFESYLKTAKFLTGEGRKLLTPEETCFGCDELHYECQKHPEKSLSVRDAWKAFYRGIRNYRHVA